MRTTKMQTDEKTDERQQSPEEHRIEASLTVNDPFRGRRFAANKKLTPEELALLETAIAEMSSCNLRWLVI